MGRKIDRMTEEDFREMNDLKKEKRGVDADLPEMSSESHWYINEIQAQQIIDTPRTIIEESDVFSDLSLPKAERIENAGRILELRRYRKALETIADFDEEESSFGAELVFHYRNVAREALRGDSKE